MLFPQLGFHRFIMRRIVLSKPATFRGWVCAFYTVPALAIAAIAALVLSPAQHHKAANGAAGTVSSASLAPQPATATPSARSRIQASYAALPLAFEQNQGQTDAQVKYMARGSGYTLFLTAKDAVFSLRWHGGAERPLEAAERSCTRRILRGSATLGRTPSPWCACNS